ncbi:Lon protease 1 [Clostridium tepidiprofundi DSM 19306]|uniref:Lon protease n=1 Tax=Clostridium tepidiprofundi DSM 19306 TaxID=1121338 RepID=A0A151AV94_9CLOT|nr:endopeptidase La [Clostridium tepidiprofundi]KYH31470.1 Lon protease 1 [Clostridium tepidiprofundi DSM 19306]
MDKDIKSFTMIPLRGITIFPNMVLHFDVGRKKSIRALEEAMIDSQEIFLSAQKEAIIEEPGEQDIHKYGTICDIKQILKLPGNTIRVLVEGKCRGKIVEYESTEPFFKVQVVEVEDVLKENEENKREALVRSVKKSFEKYIKLLGNIGPEAIISLEELDENNFVDSVASYLILNQEAKQELLQIEDACERLEKLLTIIENENSILSIEKKIGMKVKKKIDKSQKEYFLREQMKVIQEELGEEDESKKEIAEYQRKIDKARLPKVVKEKAIYELNRLKGMGNYSPESSVIRTYLDWIIELPWNKLTKDNLDIKKVRKVLDDEHYGLKDVKDRIIEYLAVRKISKTLRGPILCLVGPPGVGKTSIAKSIANALNRNFVRMSLGGVRDESEIRGHRKTYVGAIPGRIIYSMRQAKSRNPLFLLDEIDKMSNDFRGDPADALLEVLDGEQNSTFRDHYLELDFDLSKVLFVTTANRLDTIPLPLLDRMEIIEVSGYTYEEKLNIAKKYLVPKKLKEHNIDSDKIKFSDNSLKHIINYYTRESGVRDLERKISSVIRKSITEILEKDKKSILISVNQVRKYLGAEIYNYDIIDKTDKVGIVTGLAWTAYGGDTLPVEVSVMNGNGKLELTGQLGEVMQESARAGYSYVRAHAHEYKIDDEFYKNKDIHIHVRDFASKFQLKICFY